MHHQPEAAGPTLNGEVNRTYITEEDDMNGEHELHLTPEPGPIQVTRIPRVTKILGHRDDLALSPYPYAHRKSVFSRPPSIVVGSGTKSYGKHEVLQQLNMTVMERTIYGLVGASGCGKTTLLSCIVGLRNLSSGNIHICGEAPGSPASGVPGKRVGYMPQEIALNGEFTLKEVCHFFGRIYGMEEGRIVDRIDYLVGLLDLKRCRGQIQHMSGGQQRRVSFAVALLHEPEILILDEPTVGVDPVLRANIWKHLRELVSESGVTVLLTTHYIEEMRNADTVGIMRSGELMAEDSPSNLLEVHGADTLEEVVLTYCLNDSNRRPSGTQSNVGPNRRYSVGSAQFHSGKEMPGVVSFSDWRQGGMPSKAQEAQTNVRDRMKALVRKNLTVMLRNIPFLLFLFVIPSSVVAIFCFAIGSEPVDLQIGVINRDVAGPCLPGGFSNCSHDLLSCRFLELFDGDSIKLVPIQDEAEALREVDKKNLWGYIKFAEGFSESIFARTLGKAGANSNKTIYGSQIRLKLDMSSISLGHTIRKLMFETYRDFSQGLLGICDIDATGRDLPIVFEEPFYGRNDAAFTEFVAPGVAMGFLFFMGALTCGLAYIIEKKDGMLNRTLVAGVTTMEIMVSHLITQFGVVLIQGILVFIVMFVAFDIPKIGSPVLAFVLALLVSISGMSLGFLLSTVCDQEKNAMLLAMGWVFPNFLLAGQIWPVEGLPPAFLYISYFLPGTLSSESVRSILLRGWTFTNFNVWIGFVTTIAWIILYWILTYLIHRLRGRKN